MPLLLDTDILIDYLRARPEAVAYLEGLTGELHISALTVAELYAGVRDGAERVRLDAFVRAFSVVAAGSEIAQVGGLYRRDYGKSHGIGLADAIIAATATLSRLSLATLNKRHYPMLPEVIVPYQK